ncbi:MAG: hypothetical protein ACKOPE_11325 [Novosphingobium sp.]
MSSLPVLTTPDPALFSRERQATFLAALAGTGNVRSASARAGVSHQTAYRTRLASPGFRRAWDAALLAARAQAEEVLACRALDGWEEDVLYHGEVVATRRRYSDRLLLAHLARLDRLCSDAEIAQFADAFDASMARFAAGEDRPAREIEPDPAAGAGEGADSSLELWSTRSKGAGEGRENSRVPLHHSPNGPADASRPLRVPRSGEDLPPPLPPQDHRGEPLGEAQQLEVGLFDLWWDEDGERQLTTWPAPADFAGEELTVDGQSGEVLGPWPLAADDRLKEGTGWARTLTPAEEAGLDAAENAAAAHRAARLALYQRAAFGLASAAECASIAAANPGDPQWAALRSVEFANMNFS